MPQVRVNGTAAEGQFLTGALTWFRIDEVDGTANIANFGFTAGSADPGEKLLNAFATVANPVVVESGNARIMYVATEVPGITAGALQTAIRSATGYSNLTVVAGSVTVV
jgi:hypothetical protein